MTTCVGKREELSIKRRQALLSQMSVAARIGVSQGQYSNIEAGYATPTEDQANALIEMFGLPKDYFKQEEGKIDGQEPDKEVSD